jgi:hypothetical protein
MAEEARRRAYARAARVRYEVAARRALGGRRPWYSRWYRLPGRMESFAEAVDRGLRDDPAYLGAVTEMVAYLDVAIRQARDRGHRADHALQWLLRQLVLLLRPLMGERAAVQRVAALVIRRSTGHRGIDRH